MPMIGYKCKDCATEKDEIVKHPIPESIPCVKEGCTGTMERQISGASALVFKGSGFYTTDYKKRGR